MKTLSKAKEFMDFTKTRICVFGLGYVGLPLALSFSKFFSVVGFDLDELRIRELEKGFDKNSEVEVEINNNLFFSSNISDLKDCNCYIVALPTPINSRKRPDLTILSEGSKMISKLLNFGDLVIYESTVYPGCTEEYCVPVLEKGSNLKFNEDFFCGYSPERINPGDQHHQIEDVVKIVSGSTKKVSMFVDKLYSKIIKAGTLKVSSIRVAEAAKVIENTQRDLNIAFMNELSIIFDKLKLNTEEVLEAAESKWNFHKYRPGLVGGHCIGVDPYYLTYKAQKVGYTPKIILSGRNINDSMSNYITKRLIDKMKEKKIKVTGSNILILGLAFKENCSDLRNSKTFDIISKLKKLNCTVEVYDPFIKNYKSKIFKLILKPKTNRYDAVIITVKHNVFKKISDIDLKSFCKDNHVIYDLKYLFKKEVSDLRL